MHSNQLNSAVVKIDSNTRTIHVPLQLKYAADGSDIKHAQLKQIVLCSLTIMSRSHGFIQFNKHKTHICIASFVMYTYV